MYHVLAYEGKSITVNEAKGLACLWIDLCRIFVRWGGVSGFCLLLAADRVWTVPFIAISHLFPLRANTRQNDRLCSEGSNFELFLAEVGLRFAISAD